VGAVGPKVVIIDDMLDTGGTLVPACEKLRAAGTQEIYILVTLGFFTGTSWVHLWSLGVKQIFCADKVPLPQGIESGNILVVSIVPMIQRALTGLSA
jgi:ribose-phosphate pyrophosphokinase